MIGLLDAVLEAHGGLSRWVDIAGGFAAIQYVSDMVQADGIKVPTKRRAYRCDADGRVMPDELMVSIDLHDIHFA
jgi:hypothetical protein